jgi:16S rRNA (guanine527-N7)-methyltransferase
MPAPPAAFLAALTDLRLDLPAEALARLGTYLDLLLEANRHFNLTAVRDPEEAWTRHILDSLVLLPALPAQGRLIDVGSGGGLPGLPVAIARPELAVTLLEATGKKCRFLEDTARALGLDQVTVLPGRAETVANDPAWREGFDVATARAVAGLPTLLELTLPFVRVGGELVALKGARAEEEAMRSGHALRCLGGGKPVLRRFPHPALAGACLVRVAKVKPTPAGYPRAPGKPGTDPLGGKSAPAAR